MKSTVFLITFLLVQSIFSQEHAWVYFDHKQDVTTYLANPLTMLTQRSLDRRIAQGIALDETDVPITQTYVDQVENSTGITVKATSKWMNAVHVLGSEADVNALVSLSFVAYIEFAADALNTKSNPIKNRYDKFSNETSSKAYYNYGGSYNQAHQIRVDHLHELDFTGEGMMIAVMDNGFPGVNTFNAFSHIRDNGQILGGYNFIERSTNIYARGTHGVSVLSTIGGFVDGQIVGTAMDADFYLFITEDIESETPVEESYWVEAAELADYYGVDVINTSLGYNEFDDYRYDYTYADMDGDTSFITRGADIAATKGMIVCNSAGNSGNNSWHYITSPADGHHVFTVGAVDSNGSIAGFSSYGPTSDGRIKPDVDAKGYGTTIVSGGGSVTTGSGTSFSSPVMAGAIACFWQAFPTKTNFEIMQMIRESADYYNNPDDHYGYGIPNLELAYYTALEITEEELSGVVIYPNPTKSELFIELQDFEDTSLEVYDVLGKTIYNKKTTQANNVIDVSLLESGIYLIHIKSNDKSLTQKFIKQ